MVPLTGTRRWVFELGTEEHKRKRTHWRHWTDPRGQVGRDGVEGRGLVCMRPARLSLPLQQHRWLPSPGPASGYPPGAAPYAALGWWAALCPSSNPPCHAVSSVPYAALKQVGGDLEEYQDFTFLTLRRAGHEAPYTGGGGAGRHSRRRPGGGGLPRHLTESCPTDAACFLASLPLCSPGAHLLCLLKVAGWGGHCVMGAAECDAEHARSWTAERPTLNPHCMAACTVPVVLCK